MIFDEIGLPRDNGASDKQDSARLAGVMETFGYRPNGYRIPLIQYIQKKEWEQIAEGVSKQLNPPEYRYVRHPLEHRYDFSRDQALCLFSGFEAQALKDLVNLDFVDGKDIFTPAHRGHVARCQGKKASWLQDTWLWFDVWRAAKFDKIKEPNQLLCMLMVADKKFLKYWLKNNDQWKKAINDYWKDSYRNESELAGHMIKTLEPYAW